MTQTKTQFNESVNLRNRLLAGIKAYSDSILKDLTDRQIALARLSDDDPTLTAEEKVVRDEAKTLIRVAARLLKAANELATITSLVTPLPEAEKHVGKSINGWLIRRVAYEVMDVDNRVVYLEADCPKCNRKTILRASAIFSGQANCGKCTRRIVK